MKPHSFPKEAQVSSKVQVRIKEKSYLKAPSLQLRVQSFGLLTQPSHPINVFQQTRVDPGTLLASDVLQLQRTIGNRAVGNLIAGIALPQAVQQRLRIGSISNAYALTQGGQHSGGAVIARAPDKTKPAPKAKMPVMTPEDMYNKLIAARGFEEHIPVHELEATEKRLEAMRAELEKKPSPELRRKYNKLLNRYKLSKLGGTGAPAGAGYNTYAIIQVVDKEGNIVATAIGKYTGGDHAEEIAVARLRDELKGKKLPGGRMEVVGDKAICSKRCRPALSKFAKDYDLEKVEGHVFRREKIVGKGKASEKTTARTVTKKSSEGKPLTRSSEVVYTRSSSGSGPGKPPTPRSAGEPKPTPAKPVKKGSAPASKPPTTKPPGKGVSKAPPKGKGRASLSRGKVKISSGGAWSFAGKAGTAASAGLSVWGAIGIIDSAMAQIEKAQTGSIAPEVAEAIEIVEETFPSAEEVRKDVLWYGFESEKNYPKASKWLHNDGFSALLAKGDMLETMGDHLDTVRSYAYDQEKLETEFKEQRDKIKPLLTELKKRTRVLYDIVQDLEDIMPYMLSETAMLTLWDVRTTFWNAAKDLDVLEATVSMLHWEYKKGYREARKNRRAAAEVFNYWAPAFARIWKEETGKVASPTSISAE